MEIDGDSVLVAPSNDRDVAMIVRTVDGKQMTLIFADPDAVVRIGGEMERTGKIVKQRWKGGKA